MLLSLSILKKYVKLNKTAAEIADKITLSLTEVEKIEEKAGDTVFEIENKALTHRPDCFSHLGIAREIAAYFDSDFSDPLPDFLKNPMVSGEKKKLVVKVEASDVCSRYTAIVVGNLSVQESPNWLKQALTSVGIRPINTIVDITNYVMIEFGQPIHAFDYEKVDEQTIVVRKAKNGEQITTLDGKNRTLDESMLVIADNKKPIGIAGVMGGANTEVSNTTNTIILEAATFEPKNNRRTSKSLNLRTEAATRFEKNLDPNLAYPALLRTVELLQEINHGVPCSDVVDIKHELPKEKIINVRPEWINSFLGVSLKTQTMQELLKRLRMQSTFEGDILHVTIPTYRSDISRPADIAEEIARIYGYDTIPTKLPSDFQFSPKTNANFVVIRRIKTLFMGMGFTEVSTPPFVGDDLLKKYELNGQDHLELKNPLTVDQKYLRRILLPSLIELVPKNTSHASHFELYEIGRIYVPKGSDQPYEPEYLSGISSQDFRHTKGIIEELFDRLAIQNISFKKYAKNSDLHNPLFHAENTAQVFIGEKPIGVIGYLHPKITSLLPRNTSLVGFDFDISSVVEHVSDFIIYNKLPQFPPVIEEVTIEVENSVTTGDIITQIYKQSAIIKNVEYIGFYENKKSFRIIFQSDEKSLTENEVKKVVLTITTLYGK